MLHHTYHKKMKQHPNYFLMSVILLMVALTGCGGVSMADNPLVLELPLRTGQKYTQTLTVTSNMILPIGIPNADYRKSTVQVACEVTDVDDQGNAVIQAVIESIQAEMKSLSVSASYDSRAADVNLSNLNANERKFYDNFKGLPNSTYTVKVNAQRHVTQLEGLSPALQQAMDGKAEGAMGGDQLVLVFTKDNLQDVVVTPLFRGLETLGPTGLDPNDTWTDQQGLRVPRAEDKTAARTYTFEKVDVDAKDEPIALIRYHAVLTEEQAAQAAQTATSKKYGMVIVQGAARGSIEYSLKHRVPLRQTEKARIEIRTSQVTPRKETQGQRRNQIFYDIDREITRH